MPFQTQLRQHRTRMIISIFFLFILPAIGCSLYRSADRDNFDANGASRAPNSTAAIAPLNQNEGVRIVETTSEGWTCWLANGLPALRILDTVDRSSLHHAALDLENTSVATVIAQENDQYQFIGLRRPFPVEGHIISCQLTFASREVLDQSLDMISLQSNTLTQAISERLRTTTEN